MSEDRIQPEKPRPFRVGSVSYLNAKPLIFGLEEQTDIDLSLEIPSKLIDGLKDERYDVALLPVIDYQRLKNLLIVPSGGIGSNGPTLTVRIFSAEPIETIRTLACDTDSHTSVALARVILAETYGLHPELLPLLPREGERRVASLPDRSPLLLIGDKVVCEEPKYMPFQLDLGEAWLNLTGLPFVFAVWVARGGIDLQDLPERLEHAKNLGMQNLDNIVERFAIPRGWPADLAMRYMTVHLKYDISVKQLEAIALFHQLAAKYGMLEGPVEPLKLYHSW